MAAFDIVVAIDDALGGGRGCILVRITADERAAAAAAADDEIIASS